MITLEQREDFESFYNFMGFVQATGLKTPLVGRAYNDFKTFTLNLVKSKGFGIISEAFEIWAKTQTAYQID